LDRKIPIEKETVMAVPKNKKSKAKSRARRAARDRIQTPSLSLCPNCGQTKLPHIVCPLCGYYKNSVVMEIEFKK